MCRGYVMKEGEEKISLSLVSFKVLAQLWSMMA